MRYENGDGYKVPPSIGTFIRIFRGGVRSTVRGKSAGNGGGRGLRSTWKFDPIR